MTSKGGHLFQCKEKGLVRDVFTFERTSRLIGNMGIGHGKLLSHIRVSRLAPVLVWDIGWFLGRLPDVIGCRSYPFHPLFGLLSSLFPLSRHARVCNPCWFSAVRYPTAGTSSNAESQPFYVNSPYGISLAHVCDRIVNEQSTCNVKQSVVLRRDSQPIGAERQPDQ